jgi:2-methylisocitrate lyase-like PEP mutase family enzyme
MNQEDLSPVCRRAAFRQLHESGHFIIPNPWDIGGARRLEKLGFKALGLHQRRRGLGAGQRGRRVDADEALDHLRMLCAATDLPVNADFEAGFADSPEGVAANVTLAVDTGVAGVSIEDWSGEQIYPLSLAVERIAAARAAIDASGQDVLLVGRSEGFRIHKAPIAETIARLTAYSAAGADVLYAPWVVDVDEVAAIVAAVAPKPLNVLLHHPGVQVAELAAVGVRRLSVGARLASYAWAAFEAAADLRPRRGPLALRQRNRITQITQI